MTDKMEINKHGQLVDWRGQSCVYYKDMVMIVFEEKDVLDYATRVKTVADAKDQAKFNMIQAKIKKTIMASRVNQEIILFNRLQSAKCKPDEYVVQYVDKMFTIKAQLAALNADQDSDTSFRYRKAVGMLVYLVTSSRPDLTYALVQLSRFVSKPSSRHVGAIKHVLREASAVVLESFSDSDWANDPDTRKSTTGFAFTLAGGTISWMSRRQSIVVPSTAEAEYVASCKAALEAVAESNILQEIIPKRIIELCTGTDSQSALIMAINPSYCGLTRHVELRWHYVREQIGKGVVYTYKVKGTDNPADKFTKPLNKVGLKHLLQLTGVGVDVSDGGPCRSYDSSEAC
ncbi:hypothetical protein PC119_g20794 [Phytophthora cactorum]|nr:hypothetical protein PC114_g21261 [Phytophthora cactorum]KAG2982600.1 hypothetical protein PC119_g20794 [Phytophthora cactorum]